MIRILLATALSLSVLAGCTRNSGDADNSIQYALEIGLSGLDPALRGDASTNEVLPNIFDTLYEYHYLKRPIQIVPLLAVGMPQVSKDGLVHTIKIKPGVRFHDSDVFPDGKGRVLTAQDFIYSWRRLADPKVKSEGWWIFDGKIKGLNEWRERATAGKADYNAPIEGLQAPDANTLVITLTRPYYQLHYVLTMPFTAPVAREAVEKYKDELLNHPVGTGPYIFESWTRGSKVVLNKNPNWHGGTYPTEGEPTDQADGYLADAGKALPFADKIVFHEMVEAQPRWLNFMKGGLDYSGIPKDNFDAAMSDSKQLKPEIAAKGIRLNLYPYPDVTYLGFNMDDPVVGKNRDLREALCYAYDDDEAIKKFYNGRAIPAHSPIPPEFEGYEADFKLPCKEHNLAKAKELLKKAGFPDGKGLGPIEYSFNSSTSARQMAEYVAQQFQQIGVTMNLVSHSWPQFQDRLHAKKAQTFGVAWLADYPDSENMLQIVYGPNESPGANHTNFKNKEYDALYVEASKLPPGPARTEIYKKMKRVFAREIPFIPNVHRLGYSLSHGWLNNYKPHRMLSGIQKYLRVDVEKKKDLKGKL